MKVKTSELTGAALDWAVAQAEGLLAFGYRTDGERFAVEDSDGGVEGFMPSTNWAHGGPIIEREEISIVRVSSALWDAHMSNVIFFESGPTPLIAAMRCYVASQLGDEVEVPFDVALDSLIYETGDDE